MSKSLIISTFILLAVIAHARTQYVDFFQSFSAFIQPYQTTRKPDIVTKRTTIRPASKQRYEDTVFFETDDFIKQKESGVLNPFTTTSKPKRKNKATTRKPTTRSWFQDNINAGVGAGAHDKSNNANTERDTKNYNNQAYNYDANQIINNSRYNDNNNVYNNYNYDTDNKRQTTEKPVEYNHDFAVAQKPISRPAYDRHTTINPLLYRPGVRPAVVDDNRPPITNRPITNRPVYDRPVTDNVAPIGSGSGSVPRIEVGPDEDAMSEAEKRRYIEIAEQKCDEYKAKNTKKVVALPLATIHSSQGVELDVISCTPINIPLIIGGKVVSIQEFPHMSLVGWKNIQNRGYTWKCGGSLISEQYILTAGHCTYYDKDYNVISGPPAAVQLGSSYIDGGDALVVTISSVVRHPKYKVRRSYYDVALIKLTTTVSFSEKISPACLGVPPTVGNRIIATGWGRTEFGGDSSQELRSVSVPIWDMGECRAVWGTSRKLPEGPSATSQLCAGERSGGKDTCQGDSGGPAQLQDGCAWRVVAVTSVGRSCGAAETPALYAKLPRAFISKQVFSNVKLSNNRHNNTNNGNNNWGGTTNNGNNNNWGGNTGNNDDNVNFNNRDEITRPGNHQTVGNNWSVASNQYGNTQSFGSNSDVIRPGNHQSTDNNNQFANSQGVRDENFNRPGNHQTVDNNNRKDVGEGNYFVTSQTSGHRDAVSRLGNHQTVDTNTRGNDAVVNYFVTSQTSSNNRDAVSSIGNHQTVDTNARGTGAVSNYFVTSQTSGQRDAIVSRPGNHQTIDNNNRDGNTGNNYFATSHTSGYKGSVISRPGNHQTIENNNNRGAVNNNNRFSDSLNSESNQDAVYNAGYQSDNNNNNENNQNNNAQNHNSGYDNVRNSNTWSTTNVRPETNNNNEQNNRHSQNRSPYSNFGSQNSDYGTTENILHNVNNNNNNNNGYNVNNNREYVVANRPWWNR